MIILMAVTWALAGFVAAVLVGTEIGPAFGFRNMEGSSAIFGVMVVGPMGALGGLIFGIWCARRFASDKHKLNIATAVPWLVGAVLVILAVFDNSSSGITPGYSYASIWLEFRLPPGVPAPAGVRAELRTDKHSNALDVTFNDPVVTAAPEGSRVTLRGYVDAWSRTPNRTIMLRIGDGPVRLYKLKLPASPPNSEFGAWHETDQIELAGAAPRTPQPGENIDIRYSVDLKP